MLGFKDLIEGEKYLSEKHMLYMKKDGGLYNVEEKRFSMNSMDYIMRMKFEKVPWKPKFNESYFIIDMTYECGYIQYNNTNSLVDIRMIKYDEVFKTEEEVIECRNKKEWWEGDK